MSIKAAQADIDVMYVTLQKRLVPAPGEREVKGVIYGITKDKIVTPQTEILNRPFITLDVGKTYRFVVNTPKYPFYITTSPVGAGVYCDPPISYIGSIDFELESADEKGNCGIEEGQLTWTPSPEHAQMKLFYQCNIEAYMGNDIVVRFPPY